MVLYSGLGVVGPLHLFQHTGPCPCWSVVLKTTHETRLRALLGLVSSKRPSSVREEEGRTEKKARKASRSKLRKWPDLRSGSSKPRLERGSKWSQSSTKRRGRIQSWRKKTDNFCSAWQTLAEITRKKFRVFPRKRWGFILLDLNCRYIPTNTHYFIRHSNV